MCMYNDTLKNKLDEIKEFERMIDEAQSNIDALKDEIKAYMGDETELHAGGYKVTWKTVDSSRIDTTALKKALPDIAARFMKTSTTRRFIIG